MNQYESFTFLFTDSLYSNLIISPARELAIHVMKIMGSYSVDMIFIIATLGALVSALINYIFGMVLYNIYKASSDQNIKHRYMKFTAFFKKYGIMLMLLGVVPYIGKFMTLLAGFSRFGAIRSIFLASFGKAIYYIYILYL